MPLSFGISAVREERGRAVDRVTPTPTPSPHFVQISKGTNQKEGAAFQSKRTKKKEGCFLRSVGTVAYCSFAWRCSYTGQKRLLGCPFEVLFCAVTTARAATALSSGMCCQIRLLPSTTTACTVLYPLLETHHDAVCSLVTVSKKGSSLQNQHGCGTTGWMGERRSESSYKEEVLVSVVRVCACAGLKPTRQFDTLQSSLSPLAAWLRFCVGRTWRWVQACVWHCHRLVAARLPFSSSFSLHLPPSFVRASFLPSITSTRSPSPFSQHAARSPPFQPAHTQKYLSSWLVQNRFLHSLASSS